MEGKHLHKDGNNTSRKIGSQTMKQIEYRGDDTVSKPNHFNVLSGSGPDRRRLNL